MPETACGLWRCLLVDLKPVLWKPVCCQVSCLFSSVSPFPWAPHIFLTCIVELLVLNTSVINFELPIMRRCHIKERCKSTSPMGSFNQDRIQLWVLCILLPMSSILPLLFESESVPGWRLSCESVPVSVSVWIWFYLCVSLCVCVFLSAVWLLLSLLSLSTRKCFVFVEQDRKRCTEKK